MIEEDLKQFLGEWNSPEPTLVVHTSGSTGTPKPIHVEKQRMRASARMTCDFLGLLPGQTALLCMPLRYIAGKMMVVRSLERGLKLLLAEPSGRPTSLPGLDFVAMVPMQVWNCLQDPAACEWLRSIKHLIIGGGAIDASLKEQLREFPNAVWSTYGMTETLSHIAMRRLSGPEASEWYTPLPGVNTWAGDNQCLCVEAPEICSGVIVTNDIVEYAPGSTRFRVLGRLDNVICSGGVKIQAEEVERALRPLLGDSFMITNVPDARFGQAVAMLCTKEVNPHVIREALPNPYWMPRKIIPVKELPLTGTGKPDRAKAKALAASLL